MTVHENGEHHVWMGRNQRIVLLSLADSLRYARRRGRRCAETLNVLVLAVEADHRILRRNRRAVRANRRNVVRRHPLHGPLARRITVVRTQPPPAAGELTRAAVAEAPSASPAKFAAALKSILYWSGLPVVAV